MNIIEMKLKSIRYLSSKIGVVEHNSRICVLVTVVEIELELSKSIRHLLSKIGNNRHASEKVIIMNEHKIKHLIE